MLTWRLVLVSLAVVVGGACAKGTKDDVPRATVATAPTTSTPGPTTTVPDASVIPAAIDEPYLNAVLAALDHVDGEATRLIVANKRFTREAAVFLNAIYNGQEFSEQSDVWLSELESDPDLTGYRPEPGDRRSQIKRTVTVSSTCVWLAVERDYSAIATNPAAETSTVYVALRPLDEANDPGDRNPSAWMIDVEGSNTDGAEPSNQCAGS